MRYGLDAHSLRAALPVATVARIDLEVFESIDSTNAHLMRQPATVPGRMAVCVARSQTAGRGRQGRDWISPDGRGIYLSVGWTFEQLRTDAPALSLAVAFVSAGVSVKFMINVLNSFGLTPFGYYRLLLAAACLLMWN